MAFADVFVLFQYMFVHLKALSDHYCRSFPPLSLDFPPQVLQILVLYMSHPRSDKYQRISERLISVT